MNSSQLIQQLTDGRTDLVFDLVAQGYPLRSEEAQGTSLIKWCAYYGDVSAIRYLLSKGVLLTDLGKNYDLNGAVFHGHWQLCQFLLEQGADAKFVMDDTGENLLHAAFTRKTKPASHWIVKLLFAYGADPNHATMLSLSRKRLSIAQLLLLMLLLFNY
jgi:uncharacterized protein